MTKMTHDEMIAVIQAHKEGKEIEFRSLGRWETTKNPVFDFSCGRRYRIKPPKIEAWGIIKNGELINASIHKKDVEYYSPAKLIRLIPDPNWKE